MPQWPERMGKPIFCWKRKASVQQIDGVHLLVLSKIESNKLENIWVNTCSSPTNIGTKSKPKAKWNSDTRREFSGSETSTSRPVKATFSSRTRFWRSWMWTNCIWSRWFRNTPVSQEFQIAAKQQKHMERIQCPLPTWRRVNQFPSILQLLHG